MEIHKREFDDSNLILENDLPVLKNNNVECFGNYNPKTQKFSFNNEIYKFKKITALFEIVENVKETLKHGVWFL